MLLVDASALTVENTIALLMCANVKMGKCITKTQDDASAQVDNISTTIWVDVCVLMAKHITPSYKNVNAPMVRIIIFF